MVRSGMELIFGDFLDQPGLGEPSRELLHQPVVLRARQPAALVAREGESVRKVLPDGPLSRTIFYEGLARPVRCEFCGSAMLVSGAEEDTSCRMRACSGHTVPPEATSRRGCPDA